MRFVSFRVTGLPILIILLWKKTVGVYISVILRFFVLVEFIVLKLIVDLFVAYNSKYILKPRSP